jgi:hypothetical protein
MNPRIEIILHFHCSGKLLELSVKISILRIIFGKDFALPVSLYAPTSGRAPALIFKSDWGRVCDSETKN